MASTTPPSDSVPVTINGQTIDPQETYAQDAAHTNYITIGVYDVLSIGQEVHLERLGVSIRENLGEGIYLCYYEAKDLSSIRELDFIRQVDVYRNKFKIQVDLGAPTEETQLGSQVFNRVAETKEEECLVDVMVHEEVLGEISEVAERISECVHVPADELRVTESKVRLRVKRTLLPLIASDDRVRMIEEVVPIVLHDDVARKIVNADITLEGLPFRGRGQRVAVADTGFDRGDLEKCHPAFAGRVRALLPVSRKGLANDPHGHGTHVCGMVLGRDFDTPKGRIGGVAQDSELVVQSLWNNEMRALESPVDLKNLFWEPYELHECRIHSNSWGDAFADSSGQRHYTDAAKHIDKFVWDHPETFICFSAGNNGGPDRGPTIGAQAAAKNCLTVGASGSTRVNEPGKNAKTNFSPGEVLVTSSRGPTVDGLIKPDVVAPGFNIFSAQSTDPKAAWYGEQTDCPTEPGARWKPLSGTSQATPLVAGCVAVLREILHTKGVENPPSVLLRCLIINGADHLPGIPVEAQGFGRVNLTSTASMLESTIFTASDASQNPTLPAKSGCLIGPALKQGEVFRFALNPKDIDGGASALKVTLAYHDLPGSKIQNNLNLIVQSGNSLEYGNGGSAASPDVQNNVEQVILDPIPQTEILVSIEAQNILANSEQSFAISWLTSPPASKGD
ncbi:hypothetical protein G7Z17_g3110 [Cylindrodendrum hubeiense]|uniref:Peptidase S8/S53 domain-containing protein n=1 Tax=Cylindrodendrum hubeiense TaxID=595255 RepID=A0A9P5LKC2_9HYPO|nr:hypothetical protein G7Z17_g3110 [Cylindrodendrum hubeiense]